MLNPKATYNPEKQTRGDAVIFDKTQDPFVLLGQRLDKERAERRAARKRRAAAKAKRLSSLQSLLDNSLEGAWSVDETELAKGVDIIRNYAVDNLTAGIDVFDAIKHPDQYKKLNKMWADMEGLVRKSKQDKQRFDEVYGFIKGNKDLYDMDVIAELEEEAKKGLSRNLDKDYFDKAWDFHIAEDVAKLPQAVKQSAYMNDKEYNGETLPDYYRVESKSFDRDQAKRVFDVYADTKRGQEILENEFDGDRQKMEESYLELMEAEVQGYWKKTGSGAGEDKEEDKSGWTNKQKDAYLMKEIVYWIQNPEENPTKNQHSLQYLIGQEINDKAIGSAEYVEETDSSGETKTYLVLKDDRGSRNLAKIDLTEKKSFEEIYKILNKSSEINNVTVEGLQSVPEFDPTFDPKNPIGLGGLGTPGSMDDIHD